MFIMVSDPLRGFEVFNTISNRKITFNMQFPTPYGDLKFSTEENYYDGEQLLLWFPTPYGDLKFSTL